MRSTGSGKVTSDTRAKVVAFNAKDQNTEWTKGSIPSVPKSALGRSQSNPNSPSAKTCVERTAPSPKDGRNSVKAQTTKPTISPVSAPALVAPRQKIPPRSAGRNCAIPTKAISPMAAKAAEPPEMR